MAIKKSELYSSLWSSCDELRGGMDASQDKDYVLVLLRLVRRHVRHRMESGEPMRPSSYDNKVSSPGFNRLDEAGESGKVVHLCASFDDLSQYLSMNQVGLLFSARWVDGDVEPDLKNVGHGYTIQMDCAAEHGLRCPGLFQYQVGRLSGRSGRHSFPC